MGDETIKPALTAEEWAAREADGVFITKDGAELINDRYPGTGFARPAAVMALANACLPDDSPYKITREDVEHLTNAVNFTIGQNCAERPDVLLGVIAKLSSLLPPEGT